MDDAVTEKDSENVTTDSVSTEPERAAVQPAQLTNEQLQDLQTQAAKADEHWERMLRLAADFENFKKRTAREQTDARKFANEGLIAKLLPILDNFEMAMQVAADPKASSIESLRAGVEMIQQQLRSALREAGVEELDAAGAAFDPNLHEAVSQAESADVPEGHVMQQLRRGYRLNGRLLRPATVVVARKPAA
jgi:molecular chaperone GrpE